ncbi:MAG: N-acetylneuraminate synthase [Parcubacteria group bacterium GW2011_GWA2_51_12]|nr:MAG: N-acetylneuraminate synthase [Parcubacteria group bacterium GW2011_GWA2_51_12]
MAKTVKIGNKLVGEGQPVFIIAEIGINHNGDINIAKKLIDVAAEAGADAVKFQKRTVEVVYTSEELAKPRENPFGPTNGDLKRGLEFGLEQYQEVDRHCKEKGILWSASSWDEGSVDFIDQFNPPCHKIASASLTDDNLLRHIRSKGRSIILSTGMSTMEEVDHAIEVLGRKDLIILHSNSTYPADFRELNLLAIKTLQKRYIDLPVGYSGHEVGLSTSVMAAVLGACVVERHLTLDRAAWGSDHAASLEPRGMQLLVRDIRAWEQAKGDGVKRVYESEIPIKNKLRRK